MHILEQYVFLITGILVFCTLLNSGVWFNITVLLPPKGQLPHDECDMIITCAVLPSKFNNDM